eukprot:gene26596-18378_t
MVLYFTKDELENTPSRRDGVDSEKERDFRKTYTRFICSMGKDLKLSQWTLETACVLTHRFYTKRSVTKNDRFLVATGALFLACKIDESPRNLRDLAYVYQMKKLARQPDLLKKLNTDSSFLDPHMESLMLAERALLYTLDFELNVEHPFNVIIRGLQKLGMLQKDSKDSKDSVGSKLSQLAVNFCNDSLGTTLLLEYSADKVAHAAIFKAASMTNTKLPLPEGETFCSFFGVTQEEIDDIVVQFMAQYVAKKGADEKTVAPAQPQPPTLQELKAKPAGAATQLLQPLKPPLPPQAAKAAQQSNGAAAARTPEMVGAKRLRPDNGEDDEVVNAKLPKAAPVAAENSGSSASEALTSANNGLNNAAHQHGADPSSHGEVVQANGQTESVQPPPCHVNGNGVEHGLEKVPNDRNSSVMAQ